ncbi:hypothetical protein HD554DRAFT_2172371 [Boletus coccyginus]|nr:hypothetical protein HD554DRAFT_2172371 [Boletus coccyginus]
MASVPSDLGKLTVPQLKALCKERRITGYSKLSKAALLQRLAEVVAPAKTTTPSNDRGATAASSIRSVDGAQNLPAYTESSTASREANATKVVHQPAQPLTAGNTDSTETFTAKAPLPTEVFQSSHGRTATSTTSTQKTSGAKWPAHIDPKRIRISLEPAANVAPARREATVTKVVHQPAQPLTVGNTESTVAFTAQASLPTELSKSSHNHTVTSTTSTQKTPGTKRPARIDIPSTPKRIRTSLKSAANVAHEPPVPKTPTSRQQVPLDSSAFKVPELPAQPKMSFHGSSSTFEKRPSGTGTRSGSVIPSQITGGPGRFKPLTVSRPKHAEPVQANWKLSGAPVGSVLVSNFHATPLPILSHISFPPKASERKWVYRWAIVLSSLSPADRQTCMLVSRTFRYAVYLSATHILSRNYAGHRLDVILEQHPRNMTNFWPYVRLRKAEVHERRHAFRQSFLGQYTNSIGYDPLSDQLWTSPDDEKQVDVAIRFVLTRMWFAISVGAYGHDASTWSRCVIQDVREVVKGEIWQVIAQDGGTGGSCSFYVLEATCEVIGQPPSSQGENALGYRLRADWTAWISLRSRAPLDAGPCSLLECVKWSNTEDYYRGISKAWLRCTQGQDADSITKRSVAERYILASVVANGISGQWMSTSAMAQEFAGLPSNNVPGSRTAGRTVNAVNMYLPAHHHIESVHFTTSKGEALHGAVAVVQTPGREYYVLRDNGMQVGCEEEGIPEVWQRILGCDALGRARWACTIKSS